MDKNIKKPFTIEAFLKFMEFEKELKYTTPEYFKRIKWYVETYWENTTLSPSLTESAETAGKTAEELLETMISEFDRRMLLEKAEIEVKHNNISYLAVNKDIVIAAMHEFRNQPSTTPVEYKADEVDEFIPCDKCDRHDLCREFGCAAK